MQVLFEVADFRRPDARGLDGAFEPGSQVAGHAGQGSFPGFPIPDGGFGRLPLAKRGRPPRPPFLFFPPSRGVLGADSVLTVVPDLPVESPRPARDFLGHRVVARQFTVGVAPLPLAGLELAPKGRVGSVPLAEFAGRFLEPRLVASQLRRRAGIGLLVALRFLGVPGDLRFQLFDPRRDVVEGLPAPVRLEQEPVGEVLRPRQRLPQILDR